jgi:hypothetical protein
MSTVNTNAPAPTSLARASISRMKPRSRITYSWNQIGNGQALATSSMEQIDTVDSVNGMPALQAASAACDSPRREHMPEMPTGPSAIGMVILRPNSVVLRSTCETSRNTRWRSAISVRSLTFLRIVLSS